MGREGFGLRMTKNVHYVYSNYHSRAAWCIIITWISIVSRGRKNSMSEWTTKENNEIAIDKINNNN